jgi:hypothetical protein
LLESQLPAQSLALVALAFLAAGFVKGVVGGGLPAVAVPIMLGSVEPAVAAALTVVPVLATNIWLLVQGGLFRQVLRRYWPFLLALAIGSAIGSRILVSLPADVMRLSIGGLVVLLSPLPFIPRNWAIPATTQRWLNPVAGALMGLVGGATVMLAPAIVYFVSLRIERGLFMAAMGAVALSSMTPLFLGLAASRVLGGSELLLSSLAFVPTAIGMAAGVRLRAHISERLFQALLSAGLLLLGLNLVRRGLGL